MTHPLACWLIAGTGAMAPAWASPSGLARAPEVRIVAEQMPGPGSDLARNSSQWDTYFDEPGNETADDFVPASDARVDGVDWWGFPLGGSGPFRLTVYEDVGGVPGAALASGVVAAQATVVDVGPFPRTRFYSASLPSPLLVDAGTRYWLSVYGVDFSWVWLAADDTTGGPMFRQDGTTDWFRPDERDMAFRLTSSVSEPATATYFLSAVLLSMLARRFRARIGRAGRNGGPGRAAGQRGAYW